VGYVWIGPRGTDANNAGLRQGLADRGWIVGRNLTLEERYADGNADHISALIAELLALNVDVLVTPATLITRTAQRATKTVPIVCVTSNPVGTRLVASLSHPGGNITGLSLLSGDHSARWLELLKEAVPGLHHVVVLWNPDNAGTVLQLETMQEAAKILALDVTALPTRPADIETNLATMTSANFQGFVVTDDPSLELLAPRLVALAAQRHLPGLYSFNIAVQEGGLMSYSANYSAIWNRAAGYVDRILKGEHPADLPIEQATEVLLSINLKTAKALGLTISPTLLVAADEVIE
jgi:ABC-type uncharacterized transport system substrate-binding protein